ncbi:hypothetical protein LEMLEM_LOCUS12662 [Lemmus lemmus]
MAQEKAEGAPVSTQGTGCLLTSRDQELTRCGGPKRSRCRNLSYLSSTMFACMLSCPTITIMDSPSETPVVIIHTPRKLKQEDHHKFKASFA